MTHYILHKFLCWWKAEAFILFCIFIRSQKQIPPKHAKLHSVGCTISFSCMQTTWQEMTFTLQSIYAHLELMQCQFIFKFCKKLYTFKANLSYIRNNIRETPNSKLSLLYCCDDCMEQVYNGWRMNELKSKYRVWYTIILLFCGIILRCVVNHESTPLEPISCSDGVFVSIFMFSCNSNTQLFYYLTDTDT